LSIAPGRLTAAIMTVPAMPKQMQERASQQQKIRQ
jgi:hypothetical protein